MPLTADDVVQKRFNPTKFREGYDQDEVDDFLDEVVAELRRLNEENEDLRRQLSQCEGRVAELSRGGSGESVPAPAPAPVAAPADAPAPAAPLAPAATGGDGGGSGDVSGMLALAQRLHDEHVRNGEQERDRLVSEAQETATRLVREAEEKQQQTLGNLEQERALLERKIDELRGFERDYRSRLKSYLENQLRELENKGQVVPGRTPGARSLGGDDTAAAGGFPFGGQS
ncbi:DivIVA domain-containing protein [Aquipuribacter nitratireducens]|uniref:Cell wall synthesis protein Wag31 n=1 Tax=Aquipuribacter nitratireducens TaxID=650104 RepID=A0ABW0GSI3_9MICO